MLVSGPIQLCAGTVPCCWVLDTEVERAISVNHGAKRKFAARSTAQSLSFGCAATNNAVSDTDLIFRLKVMLMWESRLQVINVGNR